MEGCWLVAAPGRACCGCWLVAALGTGACLLGAAPRDGCCWLGRGACVLLRDVPVTAERGAAFLARSARSMSAALSRRSLCAQRPGAPRFVRVRGVAPAPRDLPERAASRIRALLRLDPPSRGGVAALRERIIKTPRGRAAAGAARTGPVAPFHHRGLRFAPPLQLNASRKPWARSSRPSPPPRRSPSRECPARSTTATGRRRRAASRRRARRRAQQ